VLARNLDEENLPSLSKLLTGHAGREASLAVRVAHVLAGPRAARARHPLVSVRTHVDLQARQEQNNESIADIIFIKTIDVGGRTLRSKTQVSGTCSLRRLLATATLTVLRHTYMA